MELIGVSIGLKYVSTLFTFDTEKEAPRRWKH